jgi:hypothetical protein
MDVRRASAWQRSLPAFNRMKSAEREDNLVVTLSLWEFALRFSDVGL